MTLEGAGKADILWRNWGTRITSTSATTDLITLAAHGCVVQHLAIDNLATGDATAGSAILVTVGDGTVISDVSTQGFWIGVDIYDGAEWWVKACQIYGSVKYGIRVAHTDLPDGGDGTIYGCQIIANGVNCDAGIYWVSSGGMRVANNKINGRSTFKHIDGIRYAAAEGIYTGILLINGNSIENYTRHGVFITSPTVGTINYITFTGNHFGTASTASSSIHLDGSAGASLGHISIAGNIVCGPSDGSVGAVKLNHTAGVHMAGNTINTGTKLTTRVGTNTAFRLADRRFPVFITGANTHTATGAVNAYADLLSVTLQDVAVGDMLKMEFDATLFGTAVGDSMYVRFMIGATAVTQRMTLVTFPTAAAWVSVSPVCYMTVDNAGDITADTCTVKVQIAKGGGTQGNVYGSTTNSRSAFAVTNLYNTSLG